MGSEVVLEYPNGRKFAVVVEGEIELGTEFELYGRLWQALGPMKDRQTRNQPKLKPQPMLCTSLGKVA